MDKPFTISQAKDHLKNVPGWQLKEDGPLIYRELVLRDFLTAVDLIDRIAAIAQELNHHPDLHLTDYKKLRIELTTHDAKGLTQNDFIEAAKINGLV